jgi:hypothetical protein
MRHTLRSVLVGVIGMMLVVGPGSRSAGAADIGELDAGIIVVRTYTPPHLRGDIRTARRTASAILGRARIEIDWLECGPLSDVRELSAACSRPVESNELIVRLLSAGTVDSGSDVGTLGFAFVDLDAGGGSLATVFADRVSEIAEAAGVGAPELLGRTIAHEIGHLLLGTNRHASRGLMRASWSGADLRRNRATEWVFDGKEGEVMRRGIASRFRLWRTPDRTIALAAPAR